MQAAYTAWKATGNTEQRGCWLFRERKGPERSQPLHLQTELPKQKSVFLSFTSDWPRFMQGRWQWKWNHLQRGSRSAHSKRFRLGIHSFIDRHINSYSKNCTAVHRNINHWIFFRCTSLAESEVSIEIHAEMEKNGVELFATSPVDVIIFSGF